MTVVADAELMTLICDSCGDTVTGNAGTLPDAALVWPLVSEEHGWSGSPFAAGPHRCPHCAPPTSYDGHGPGGILGIDHVDGVTVVSATGDIDLGTGDTLRTALRHAADMGGPVVIDLTWVHGIDSTGLGLLVRAHHDAHDRGVRLCLAEPSRFVRTVLRAVHLDGVFLVFDSRDDALAQLAGVGTVAG